MNRNLRDTSLRNDFTDVSHSCYLNLWYFTCMQIIQDINKYHQNYF